MKKKNDPAQATVYAAIDIGSNAARLLIKKRNNKTNMFDKCLLLRVPLRLGFDVFSIGKLSAKKEENLTRLMKTYRQLMKIYDVECFRACATSAMRDALNGPDIIKSIKKKTGIQIEIISGQEEAQIVYSNHMECMEDRNGNYMYVDVGGGSTEINLLIGGKLVCSRSFNIGTVRILSGKVDDGAWIRLNNEITELTKEYQNINIIGSGGNINKLYRLTEKKNKKKKRLPISSLRMLYDELAPLTPEERCEQFDMKPDRADVIIPAAKIFLTIAETINASYIHVPVIGLADGIIDMLYAKNQASAPDPEEPKKKRKDK